MSHPESPIFLDEMPEQPGRSRLAFFRNLLLFGMVAGLSLCGVALVAFVVMSARMNDRTAEIAALQDCVQGVQEFRDLRARGADNNAWAEFEARIMNRMQVHAKTLESRAAVNRPESQKLFWVAKYRMREMIESCWNAPGPAEIDCLRMLQESAAQMQYPLPPDL